MKKQKAIAKIVSLYILENGWIHPTDLKKHQTRLEHLIKKTVEERP